MVLSFNILSWSIVYISFFEKEVLNKKKLSWNETFEFTSLFPYMHFVKHTLCYPCQFWPRFQNILIYNNVVRCFKEHLHSKSFCKFLNIFYPNVPIAFQLDNCLCNMCNIKDNNLIFFTIYLTYKIHHPHVPLLSIFGLLDLLSYSKSNPIYHCILLKFCLVFWR